MVYDTIILGATFATAGMACVWGDNCLILERRPLAGYEFLNALNFGTDYENLLQSEKAQKLKAQFEKKGAFLGERVCLFECAGLLYQLLEDKNIYLNMTLISFVKREGLYEVTTHGTSGYRTFYAKHIVDTRVAPEMIESKSLNILVSGAEDLQKSLAGEDVKLWGYHSGDVVVRLAVQAGAGYIEAREQVKKFLKSSSQSLRLICMADYFDHKLLPDSQKEKDGISYLPSAGFANPLAAFDAGVLFAGGGVK